MFRRAGSRGKPSPLVELDCGSQSTSRVGTSAAASDAAKLMAVVVLPTPPFWLATAITRPMFGYRESAGNTETTPNRAPDSTSNSCAKGRIL